MLSEDEVYGTEIGNTWLMAQKPEIRGLHRLDSVTCEGVDAVVTLFMPLFIFSC